MKKNIVIIVLLLATAFLGWKYYQSGNCCKNNEGDTGAGVKNKATAETLADDSGISLDSLSIVRDDMGNGHYIVDIAWRDNNGVNEHYIKITNLKNGNVVQPQLLITGKLYHKSFDRKEPNDTVPGKKYRRRFLIEVWDKNDATRKFEHIIDKWYVYGSPFTEGDVMIRRP